MALIGFTCKGKHCKNVKSQVALTWSFWTGVPWPDTFKGFMGLCRFTMLDMFELLPFSCLLPDQTINFYSMLVATVALPIIILTVIILVVKVMKAKIRSRINFDLHDTEVEEDAFDNTCAPGVGPTDPSPTSPGAGRVARKEGELTVAEANEKCTELMNAVTRGVLILLFLAYPVLSNKLLQVFDCRLIEGTYYLTQDVDEVCFNSSWLPFGMLGTVC